MEWKIRSDIPCPKPGKRTKYPWADMDVGDSIDCPWNDKDRATFREKTGRQSAAATSARRYVSLYRPDLRVVTETHPIAEFTRIWFDAREEES